MSGKCNDAVSRAVKVIDFMLNTIRLASDSFVRLGRNLEALLRDFDVGPPCEVHDALTAFGRLSVALLPSREVCGDAADLFWRMHTAYIAYHYDALVLLHHSLLSALSGYYTAAYSELRCALEDAVRGITYDLLAIPEYRRNAEILRNVGGLGAQAKTLRDLMDLLDEEFGDRRLKVSVQVFDLIDEKLREFNPRAGFTKWLEQLKEWGIIKGEELREIKDYYDHLSQYAHRVNPRFSEVGWRIITSRDWVSLEPVPEILFVFLYHFVEVCGWILYLMVKDFSVDLRKHEFLKCVDRASSTFKEGIERVKELSQNYSSWRSVKNALGELGLLG